MEKLQAECISVEVIDLRSVKPPDTDLVLTSIPRTGRAIIVGDSAWPLGRLKAPVQRITCPDAPTPSSYVLENSYYPNASDVITAVREAVAY